MEVKDDIEEIDELAVLEIWKPKCWVVLIATWE
jgi:hypothetical protein